MPIDISTLRNSRVSNLANMIAENNTQTDYTDNRYWKITRDKSGNGSAIIRFLPNIPNSAVSLPNNMQPTNLPFVKIFSHAFKGPTGKWYIENCLSTIGMDDPVNQYNSVLWASSDDDKSPAKKQVREQKRKLNYISNILVVNDPADSENNGKVFLFKYGKKIFDKIMDKVSPPFADQTAVNVFDLWEGANFKLRIRQADGFPNYDLSEFETSSAVASSDEAILKIANACYDLNELLQMSNFKPYDQLKTKLDMTLGKVNTMKEVSSAVPKSAGPAMEYKSKLKSVEPEVPESDEDMMQYFQSIADQD